MNIFFIWKFFRKFIDGWVWLLWINLLKVFLCIMVLPDFFDVFWSVQLNGARQKMGMLLSKSTNDDLLIQALTIELATVKQVYVTRVV